MSDKPIIVVSGAGGQLGKEFSFLATQLNEFEWHFFTRQDLDISNEDALSQMFKLKKPNYFINCAAYTAVDKAESEIEQCFLINEYAVGLIAKHCALHQTKLVHFSSDYVYHLDKDEALTETDATLPRGIYAQSKLAGELHLREAKVDHVIIRASWVYSSFGNNFIKTVIRLSKERNEMKVVEDQMGTLSYARDLAEVVIKIINAGDKFKWNEVYNYSSEGISSWFEIAEFVAKKMNLGMTVKAIPSKEYPTAAERPLWSVMSKSKISKALNTTIPSWQSTLERSLVLFDN